MHITVVFVYLLTLYCTAPLSPFRGRLMNFCDADDDQISLLTVSMIIN